MRSLGRVAVVGAGRLGGALAWALRESGVEVDGPLGRGEALAQEDTVALLCVPDGEIRDAAALIAPGLLVGHCSGATGLDVLAGHRAFSIHPLMTVPAGGVADFRDVACAVEGDPVAGDLAERLGMRPISIAAQDRAAYHAAASIASNFLVVLEGAAERIGGTAGLSRADLVPLVRATVENWARMGPEALTGPVVRGDEGTIAAHREALRERTPDLLGLYDAMVEVARR